jgi:hypothetical protein
VMKNNKLSQQNHPHHHNHTPEQQHVRLTENKQYKIS